MNTKEFALMAALASAPTVGNTATVKFPVDDTRVAISTALLTGGENSLSFGELLPQEIVFQNSAFSSSLQDILNEPINYQFLIDTIIADVANGSELDESDLGTIVDPNIVGWNNRTIYGQMLVNSIDISFLSQKLPLDGATVILSKALQFGNQGTNPELCDTVNDQKHRASGKFAKDLDIRSVVSGKSGAKIAQAMCESTVSGTLEEVISLLGYEITEDTVIYNLFGSGDNPDGTNGGVGIPYRIAKHLEVTNAYITENGDLVLSFVDCGGNFGIITSDKEFIDSQIVDTEMGIQNSIASIIPAVYNSSNFIGSTGITTGTTGTTWTTTTGTGISPIIKPEPTPSPVPIPAGLLLLSTALGSLGFMSKKSNKKSS